VELRPNDGDLHYELGVALGRQGRHAEAESTLREAIRVDPGHIRAHANVALGLGRQGRHAEAESAYRVALGLRPEHPALQRDEGSNHQARADQQHE